MKRRKLLGGLGLGVAGLAGCLGGETGSDTPESGPADSLSQFRDVSLPVDRAKLNRGAAEDGIPAITDPVFGADWSGVQSRGSPVRLDDDDRVIGIERGGEARAYPLAVLNWHEIVNDDFGGPLLVTFCPLCGSGVVAERRVDGEETVFGVSGLLWRNDLVMYDRATDSLWSQIMATAIRGPRTGETLTLVPSSFTTWGEWTEQHPETAVLRPPPESETIREISRPRDYSRNPYASYTQTDRVGIGGDSADPRLDPKTRVLGITADGVARAYPLPAVRDAGLVTDTVGSLPVVVAVTGEETLVGYVRRLDGESVPAEREDQYIRLDGSRFRLADGVAVDGPHEGTQLRRATELSPMFWFAWADFHSNTDIWQP